jgi:hypothetical protein
MIAVRGSQVRWTGIVSQITADRRVHIEPIHWENKKAGSHGTVGIYAVQNPNVPIHLQLKTKEVGVKPNYRDIPGWFQRYQPALPRPEMNGAQKWEAISSFKLANAEPEMYDELEPGAKVVIYGEVFLASEAVATDGFGGVPSYMELFPFLHVPFASYSPGTAGIFLADFAVMLAEPKLPRIVIQTRELAQTGHAIAQYNMGHYHEHGKYFERDHKLAIQWYEKAMSNGITEACVALGYLYFNGGTTPTNRVKALELFVKAAKLDDKTQGNAERVAYLYKRGEGTTIDETEALAWAMIAGLREEILKGDFRAGMTKEAVAAAWSRADALRLEIKAMKYDPKSP